MFLPHWMFMNSDIHSNEGLLDYPSQPLDQHNNSLRAVEGPDSNLRASVWIELAAAQALPESPPERAQGQLCTVLRAFVMEIAVYKFKPRTSGNFVFHVPQVPSPPRNQWRRNAECSWGSSLLGPTRLVFRLTGSWVRGWCVEHLSGVALDSTNSTQMLCCLRETHSIRSIWANVSVDWMGCK